ncbi:uncharacterized protein LOC129592481 [Paramacrobiotus metropolitanus]|uniref:uncharacterized protein LOC129592481 n=1 Tax=Paramacrobiotus metropolitanus TaxID=2943436 RepID=UPI0024463D1E|nr:uncharacterized protein LOC129592481 [Paramacrobiotus metropolitanus]
MAWLISSALLLVCSGTAASCSTARSGVSDLSVPQYLLDSASATTPAPDRNQEPAYQCFYQRDSTAYCQEMARCRGVRRSFRVPLATNLSFTGYACPAAPFTRLPFSAKSGIATTGFAAWLLPSTLGTAAVASDLIFVCHFHTHRTPAQQSFTCAGPVDCSIRDSNGMLCAGVLAWFGAWTGDLQLGLWGVVMSETME